MARNVPDGFSEKKNPDYSKMVKMYQKYTFLNSAKTKDTNFFYKNIGNIG